MLFYNAILKIFVCDDVDVLLVAGMLKDDSTLRDIKLTKGTKMMVIGSTIQDVLTIAPPLPESTKPSASVPSKDYCLLVCVG